MLRALAWCEASFEFLDEEVEFGDHICSLLKDILKKIEQLKNTFDAQQMIRQGIRIALIGSVNAGKSSLFNAMLGQKRAIVTQEAGTTRDVIEAGLTYKGNLWTLIDTAGLRQTENIIEQEGIRRSHEEAHKADIILLIYDSSRNMIPQEEMVYKELYKKYAHKCIIVLNKADLAFALNKSQLPKADEIFLVSQTTKEQHEKLKEALEKKIAALFAACDTPFLLNKRQYTLLLALEENIGLIVKLLTKPFQYELISYHLRDALAQLSELTGKSISENALDMVFKEFCVGK